MSSSLETLARWYARHCDGDWEHQHGIKIETLDNPGWRASVDLSGTELVGRDFTAVKVERSADDWVQAWLDDSIFNFACGPLNIEEALGIFFAWAAA